jgi:hypothetical protein
MRNCKYPESRRRGGVVIFIVATNASIKISAAPAAEL